MVVRWNMRRALLRLLQLQLLLLAWKQMRAAHPTSNDAHGRLSTC